VSRFEITLLYPDRSFKESGQFLREVGRSQRSGLIAFHKYRDGVVLTIQVETDRDRGMAMDLARQRAAAFWPSYQSAEASVEAPIPEAG